MTTLAAKLRAEPGVDVRRLKVGTCLLVETVQHLYEMKVVVSGSGLVEITSTDPLLNVPTVGQFLSSQSPPECSVEGWIGKGLLMCIRFRNGYYTSTPVLSAEVQGADWHYAVF
jgi:hypothetical protein